MPGWRLCGCAAEDAGNRRKVNTQMRDKNRVEGKLKKKREEREKNTKVIVQTGSYCRAGKGKAKREEDKLLSDSNSFLLHSVLFCSLPVYICAYVYASI